MEKEFTRGSPTVSELPANPATTVLKAATLDDPSCPQPATATHTRTASSHPWAKTSSNMPKFDDNPG